MHEQTASKRIDDDIINQLYPRSPYARLAGYYGSADFDKYTSRDVRGFYYKWFRPDLQCMIVVGDVDLSSVETRIKSVFSTVPKPSGKQSLSYYVPRPFKGMKACVSRDKEYNRISISINMLRNPLPKKYKNSSLPYIEEYFDSAISKLLMDRIQQGIIINGLPITDLKISQGRFLGMQGSDSYAISFETLPNSVYSSLSFLSSEIKMLASQGFNSQEFGKSRELYFKNLEAIYDNRERLGNDFYLKRALSHFYDGFSLASTEMKFTIMKDILFSADNSVTLSQLNEYAKETLGAQDNTVIICKMPDYRGISQISSERILNAYTGALAEAPIANTDKYIVKWPRFENQGDGYIVSETTDPVINASVLTLSNGATVVMKKTIGSKDTISFRAVSRGGLSLIGGMNGMRGQYLNGILNIGGLGIISQPNLNRLFSYNHLKIKASLLPDEDRLDGYAVKGNEDKLMQMINYSMTARRADEDAFKVYKESAIFNRIYHTLSPVASFADSVAFYNNNNKAFVRGLSVSELNDLDYDKLIYDSRERFSNAADFIFVFAGDLNPDAMKSSVLKYIGSIPGNPSARETAIIRPDYLAKGHVYKRFLFGMKVPRSFLNITYSCGMEYNMANYIYVNLLDKYLHDKCHEGDVMKLSTETVINSRLKSYPESIAVFRTYFESDSAGVSSISKFLNASMYRIADSEMEASEFAKLVSRVKSDFMKGTLTNGYWLDFMENYYMRNKDFHTNFLKILSSVTPASFSLFVHKLLYRGNSITVIMDGTTRDVGTQNLFKENKFIRNYFEIR
jgi:zinc protease